MERNKTDGTGTQESLDEPAWSFDVGPNYTVTGYRADDDRDEHVHADLVVDLEAPTLRFLVVSYRHDRNVMLGTAFSPPPITEIEAFAAEPLNALWLIEHKGPPAIGWMPKKLAGVDRVGRKPNHFYGRVLILKRACEEAGQPYAETIAADNGVTANVVYRWVAEAKRRKITIDDTPTGHVRIDGEPMGFPTESAQKLWPSTYGDEAIAAAEVAQ